MRLSCWPAIGWPRQRDPLTRYMATPRQWQRRICVRYEINHGLGFALRCEQASFRGRNNTYSRSVLASFSQCFVVTNPAHLTSGMVDRGNQASSAVSFA